MFHVKHVPVNPADVSRETSGRLTTVLSNCSSDLDSYIDLLIWWNKKINLVSRSSGRSEVYEFVRHSLIPVALDLFDPAEIVVDTGTGGGLPGIPLAIAMPESRVILNDISTKKCLVLDRIIKELKLKNCETREGDVGKITMGETCALTTMHAFKIPDLLKKTEKINWKKAVIYKGADYKDELKKAVRCKNSTLRTYELSQMEPEHFYRNKFILVLERS